MPNESYRPDENADEVFSALKGERGGRANPRRLKDKTGIRKQYINNALGDLVTAGWVEKVTRGLYEFRVDPRTGDVNDLPAPGGNTNADAEGSEDTAGDDDDANGRASVSPDQS